MSALRALSRLNGAERAFTALAWALAIPADVSLRSAGLRRTAAVVARTPDLGLPALSVERAEQLVASAFRWSPAKNSCLPRSLVQFVLQRAAGTDVALVIGVRRTGRVGPGDEFAGHAWVELRARGPRDVEHAVIFELAGS